MPFEPETIVGEVLGRRAVKGIDPTHTDFECPYIQSRCPKRSTQLPNEPYPVCSLWKPASRKSMQGPELIFVCPKRFYAVDFLKEVIDHCWPGDKPQNPQIAREVKMEGFGNVDFVIADVKKNNKIEQFLSVELQAIDITGSVFPAYQALRIGEDLEKKPTYGFNWDNVYKRYITQLIRKGYFHHHWKSKIVAVIPEQVYQYILGRAGFMRTAEVKKDPQVNIIFMTYRLEKDPDKVGEYKPVLVNVEGTSHTNLQNAIMYKDPPQRSAFIDQIKSSLARGAVKISDLISAGDISSVEYDDD
ncbi:NotI family restriction endonuclease [Novacetimonas maltaceti]|uniref:Restriction endonuclease NotI n=2 Tax=Acetobacteraceae TaxID=433 RepID=A0A2S3VXG6_9PROT|nr:NotI family restriction endonuclease [Novacetimonas maltaceti]POF61298.1 Restriction endonuclease NotI [Novacetimonas maltaceti]